MSQTTKILNESHSQTTTSSNKSNLTSNIKRIWFIRHGQGEHNVNDDFSISDPPLTDLGRIQATAITDSHILKPHLELEPSANQMGTTGMGLSNSSGHKSPSKSHNGQAHGHIQLILTSPLIRCIQTTLIAFGPYAKSNRIPIIPLAALQESYAGNRPCDTGKPTSELKKLFHSFSHPNSKPNSKSDSKPNPNLSKNAKTTKNSPGNSNAKSPTSQSAVGSTNKRVEGVKSENDVEKGEELLLDFSYLEERWCDIEDAEKVFSSDERREKVVRDRLLEFLRFLSRREEERIAVVMHKGLLRRLFPMPKHEIFKTAEVRLVTIDFGGCGSGGGLTNQTVQSNDGSQGHGRSHAQSGPSVPIGDSFIVNVRTNPSDTVWTSSPKLIDKKDNSEKPNNSANTDKISSSNPTDNATIKALNL